jgi:hypothetical protein
VPIIELVDTSHHPPKSKAPTLDHSANPEKAAARGGILPAGQTVYDLAPVLHYGSSGTWNRLLM